jgi:hypothetical protein
MAGVWGGTQVVMHVDETGAEVEFDCARGRINGALPRDADGRFDFSGTYLQQQPGPEREGGPAAGRPARYRGRVNGRTMTLTVVVADTGEKFGPFTLALGRASMLRKCL